jgi:hypothetical protein
VHVASIHVYPLKGARGIALDRADVLRSGLRHDRRFMLVDREGVFVTQREHPRLALVETAIEPDALRIRTSAGATRVALVPLHGTERRVAIWDDHVDAVVVGGDASSLLSEHLGATLELVYVPYDTIRQVDLRYAREGDRVGFADGYPVLVASLASLADLNARLATPVPMDRFRPNVVVAGGAPWAEESAPEMTIGAVPFRAPKRCSRCDVTLVDQRTAAVGKEPLRTLATFRRDEATNKVYFAMNAIPDAEGTIAIGDPVAFAGQHPRVRGGG